MMYSMTIFPLIESKSSTIVSNVKFDAVSIIYFSLDIVNFMAVDHFQQLTYIVVLCYPEQAIIAWHMYVSRRPVKRYGYLYYF